MIKVIKNSGVSSSGCMPQLWAGDDYALVHESVLPLEFDTYAYLLADAPPPRVAIGGRKLGEYILFCYNIYLHPLGIWLEKNNIEYVELPLDVFNDAVTYLEENNGKLPPWLIDAAE